MKKLFILSVALLSLILVGCSQNTQTENSTGELSKSELFEKKQECVKYKKEIIKEIKNNYQEYTQLEEIFYNPTQDSCIYTTKYQTIFDDNSVWTQRRCIDYLSNKFLDSTPVYCPSGDGKTRYNDNTCYMEFTKFENTIKKLKGE